MGETLYYNVGLTDAINDLAKALKVKGNILNDSEIKDLTTLHTAYWDDDSASGITGCYNGTTWTVRWDYDPVKLSHINMQYGSQKAAYMELSEDDYKARQRLPEASRPYDLGFTLFCWTVKKVTSDADWNKKVWVDNRQDPAYRRECARTLRDIWYKRIYANWR